MNKQIFTISQEMYSITDLCQSNYHNKYHATIFPWGLWYTTEYPHIFGKRMGCFPNTCAYNGKDKQGKLCKTVAWTRSEGG